MRLLMAVLAIASSVWILGKPWGHPPTSQKPPPKAKFLFSLTNESVNESSGVAASKRRAGIYWTHNDSGGKAQLFAFDHNGKDVGVYTLAGVEARDWEDMASTKIDGTPYLYVGDIGDNLKNQKRVRIYRFIEPHASDPKTISKFETFGATYPDGAHNAETLMVAPNGDILVVTKSDFGDS